MPKLGKSEEEERGGGGGEGRGGGRRRNRGTKRGVERLIREGVGGLLLLICCSSFCSAMSESYQEGLVLLQQLEQEKVQWQGRISSFLILLSLIFPYTA